MEFHSLEDTLRATVDSAIEMGYIKPKGPVTVGLITTNHKQSQATMQTQTQSQAILT